jgi:predicted tellurium resistance membrane protein TerC
MYDPQMVEDHSEASQHEANANADENASGKYGIFSAMERVLHDLNFSLQNLLTAIAVFFIPITTSVFGMPLATSLALGLSIVVWFFVLKSLTYVCSRIYVLLIGTLLTAILFICGYETSKFTRAPVIPAGQVTTTGDCNGANTGNGGKVDVNCGSTPQKQDNK